MFKNTSSLNLISIKKLDEKLKNSIGKKCLIINCNSSHINYNDGKCYITYEEFYEYNGSFIRKETKENDYDGEICIEKNYNDSEIIESMNTNYMSDEVTKEEINSEIIMTENIITSTYHFQNNDEYSTESIILNTSNIIPNNNSNFSLFDFFMGNSLLDDNKNINITEEILNGGLSLLIPKIYKFH